MTRIPDHRRGYQDGIRAAVTWLHKRAVGMVDPKALTILHSAATNLGWDFAHAKLGLPSDLPLAGSHREPFARCTTCGSPLDVPNRPWTLNCGGDCLACINEAEGRSATYVTRAASMPTDTGKE